MTTHQIQLFLVDLALILVLGRLLGALAGRIGQPPVIGEIVAGILLGPTLFNGWLKSHLFPPGLVPPLTSVADLGLVLFMFIIGYELDGALIRGRERVAASVSLGSIVLPLGGGFLLGIWLAHQHSNDLHRTVPTALFVGAAMAVTAFPVLARILNDRRMTRTKLGGLAIASAAVDDIAAWSLLAVVVTIAGSNNSEQWHILLAPAYLAIMAFGVRPLMRQVAVRYRHIGRLTPDILAVVLVTLLLSAFATEWLGVHFIFGAFIMGACMPRRDAAPLRQNILAQLERISVLLLLPVFFVISGLNVDLSNLDGKTVGELVAILGVAIGGKFIGAYLGARASGVAQRQAGALATLMNTRGLTELIILTVGRQLGVLDDSLYSLMVVMALVTTAMSGPLLKVIYPARYVERDIADAERSELADTAGYRVLVVVEPDTDPVLVDTTLRLAAGRRPAQVVLSRLLPQRRDERLEVGTGMGAELLVMTKTMAELHELAARDTYEQVTTNVYSQFSDDRPGDLARHVRNIDPDLVVLPAGTEIAADDMLPRQVRLQQRLPSAPSAIAVNPSGADGAAALQVAAQLAAGSARPLVLIEVPGRRGRGLADDLARAGLEVRVGAAPDGALIVGSPNDSTAHLVVRVRPGEAPDDVDDWVGLLASGPQATKTKVAP